MPSNDEELKKRGEYTFELRRKNKTGQISWQETKQFSRGHDFTGMLTKVEFTGQGKL